MLAEHLRELADIVGGTFDSPRYQGPVAHVETDTRRAFRARSVFVALSGEHYEGTAFLESTCIPFRRQ